MRNILIGEYAGVFEELDEVDGFETVGHAVWTWRSQTYRLLEDLPS